MADKAPEGKRKDCGMILALDTATQTGWARISDDGKLMDSGTFCLRDKPKDSYGTMFNKLTRFISECDGLYMPNRLTTIAYEQAHFRSGPSTRIGVGCNTVVLMACDSMQIQPFSVHTASLKKWATGNGRASKDDMMAWAGQHCDIIDDNHADAIAVGMYAYEKLQEGA